MTDLKLKFGIVTDLHYAREDEGNRLKSQAADRLSQAMMSFKENNVDFVINLGDTIDTANNIDEELVLCEEINKIFNASDFPVYHVIGNHDVAMFNKEEFLQAMKMKNSFYSFECKGIKFFILDGNCHEDGSDFCRNNFTWDNAWISQIQLDWLREELLNCNLPAVICCHERLDGGFYNAPFDPHVIQNYAEVQNIINSDKIIAVFCGHDHAGYTAHINSIPFITCSSISAGENTAYAIIEIYDNNCLQIKGAGRFPRLVLR